MTEPSAVVRTVTSPGAPQVNIDEKVSTLTDKLNALRDDASKYEKALQARLTMLKSHLGEIRSFNAGAAELTISIDELSESIRAPIQVDSVLAAEKIVAKFQAETTPMAEIIREKFAALEPSGLALAEVAKVEEEIRTAFTLYNLDDLRSAWSTIAEATAQREEELVGANGLMPREKAKENVRIKFAEAATAFKDFVIEQTRNVQSLEEEMAITADLESMLALTMSTSGMTLYSSM